MNQYAGFWRRFAAHIIDAAIGTLFVVIYVIAASVVPPFIGEYTNTLKMIPLLLIILLYKPLFESSKYQATPGKIALGIVVTDMAGKRIGLWEAIARYIGYWISAMIFYLGFLIIPFTAKKQGLHDMIAGTLVLKK